MTAGEPCPCGSGAAAPACCAPLLAGAPAPTALALMRSRYTAYVRGEVDHLLVTHDPDTAAGLVRDQLVAYCRATRWLGLEIVDTVAGGAGDDTGVVEFVARGVTRGAPFAQRERSRFRKVDGRWRYVGAVVPAAARAAAQPGRNEPCPCGSGQKYKRCHGR